MFSKQHLSLQKEMSKTDSNNYSSSTIRAQSATGSEKIGVVIRVISESSRRGSRLAERAAAAAAAMAVVQAAEEDTQAFQTAGQAE